MRRLVGRQPAPPAYQIRAVFEELNFPSRDKLKTVLKKRNIRWTEAEIDSIVKKSGARQIYAPRSTYPGKVASTDSDTRWGADTISLVANPSTSGHKYILVVCDYFTRQTWATALKDIQAKTTADALETIIVSNGPPKELNTDEGTEMINEPFRAVMARHNIVHRIKVGREDLAVIDRRIQLLKQGLFRDTANRQTGDWASRVDKAVRALNNTPTEPLMGSDPNDVEKEPVLEFVRRKQGALDHAQNRELAKDRINKLSDAGAFRPEIPAHNFARSFKPRYGDKEALVDVKDSTRVVGESGKSYPLKYVKPVPVDSTEAVPQALGGSAQHSDRARRELRDYANRVRNRFRGQSTTLHTVAGYLRELQGFDDATRRARIRQKRRVVAFLRQFPEMFEVTSTRGRGEVTIL
ncbi:DDE-type integrase/transposase/recombinase [bacterium]|nr:DDE-type integrase/transposase/recombinase [bacterium]